MNLLFIGASGCGKDTQADLLVEREGFYKIASGDLFRDLIKDDSKDPFVQKIKAQVNSGVFPNDEDSYQLFQRYLSKDDKFLKGDKNILIGFVRRLSQVERFDQFLAQFSKKLDKAVVFDLSEETAVERLSLRRVCPKCGKNYHLKYLPPKKPGVCDLDGAKLYQREDEHPEAIKTRHQQYYSTIKEIMAAYEKQGKLVVVDANGTIEEIYKEMVEKLGIRN